MGVVLETTGALCVISSVTLCLIVGNIIVLFAGMKIYHRLTVKSYKGDQDMSGKTVLITGASSGIGKATAFDLAKRNARVILACRNLIKANQVADEIRNCTGNPNVIVKLLDLRSFKSVKKCAQDIIETEDQLHVLINNAGVGDHNLPELTEDGCDTILQSNYLGHFLLTMLLLDLLKRSCPSRIINVASGTYHIGELEIPEFENNTFKSQKNNKSYLFRYANSNLVGILFTRELAERLLDTGVTVNTLHPGIINTPIWNNYTNHYMHIFSYAVRFSGKNEVEGAQTIIRLAVDPSLEKTTGKYFSECEEQKLAEKAKDKELGQRLFEQSEQIVSDYIYKM